MLDRLQQLRRQPVFFLANGIRLRVAKRKKEYSENRGKARSESEKAT
jgi:hypothetical protein